MAKVAFRQSDVERLLRAARAVGIQHPTVRKNPDGSLDLLTDGLPKEELSPLQRWRVENGRGPA